MDNQYLQDLITEAETRGGGMILNLNQKPAAVVMTVDKYNELLAVSKNVPDNLVHEFESASTDTVNFSDQPVMPVTNSTMKENIQAPGQKREVLVTGGAGYIGSHAVMQLIKAGFAVTVLDNLSCGRRENVDDDASFIEGDLADVNLLRDLFSQKKFEAVLHFAASIEVEESVRFPEKYLENNALNTAKLIQVMLENGCKKLIFSSTCAVYKEPVSGKPLNEKSEIDPGSPYGASKYLAEQIINYHCRFSGLKAVIFRYFNACGFDPEARIKATHESHLIAKVMSVLEGQSQQITVFGGDYPTFDGTCIRDYVHVLDIVRPHILAVDKLEFQTAPLEHYNIGTGKGSSVKQIINLTSEVLNHIVPMEIGPRRPGDAMVMVADNSKLVKEFGVTLKNSDPANIIKTSWRPNV